MELKLSIIVPIYNVEKYLRKCVDSLLSQDLPREQYEIILVDDGSPDRCGEICEEYASRFGNVKVVHRKNGGLSAARNTGIEIAQGKYVQFVDSDDYLEPNVLDGLMTQIEREKLDVLRFDYQNVCMNSAVEYEVFQPDKFSHEADKQHDVVDGETYLNEHMGYACYVWQFLINRELTGMFMHGIHFEDIEWLPRMMLRAERVNSTNRIVYNYLIRRNSITQEGNDLNKRERNLNDAFSVIEQLNILNTKHPSCYWLREMRSSMVLAVLNTVVKYFYERRRIFINRLESLSVFPIFLKNRSVLLSCVIHMYNLSPLLTVDILHVFNEFRKRK